MYKVKSRRRESKSILILQHNFIVQVTSATLAKPFQRSLSVSFSQPIPFDLPVLLLTLHPHRKQSNSHCSSTVSTVQSMALENISYLSFAVGPKQLRHLAGEASTQVFHCGSTFSPVISYCAHLPLNTLC